MKATVNNSANFVINNDMLNETKCLKYVSKPTMLEEIVNIQVALAKLNSNYTPRQYTEKNSKKELFEGYGRLVTIYKELSEKREAEIAKNVATCIKTADVLAEEARVKAEAEAAKKAEEEAKRAKKAANKAARIVAANDRNITAEALLCRVYCMPSGRHSGLYYGKTGIKNKEK